MNVHSSPRAIVKIPGGEIVTSQPPRRDNSRSHALVDRERLDGREIDIGSFRLPLYVNRHGIYSG